MTDTAPGSIPCVDCGAPLTGRYCAACGQRVVEDADFSLIRLSREWLSAALSLDSRGLVTVRRLLFSPGRLSRDYIAGRRSATFGPFQIFVFITLIFFLLPDNVDIFKAPAQFFFGSVDGLVTQKMADLHITRDELVIAYNGRVNGLSKLGLILLTIPLCFVSWGLAFRRMPEIGKHLVITTHGLVFIMVYLGLAMGIAVIAFMTTDIRLPRWSMFAIALGGIAFYLMLQQWRVVGRPFWFAMIKGIVLMATFFVSSIAYRQAVSYLTLWSL